MGDRDLGTVLEVPGEDVDQGRDRALVARARGGDHHAFEALRLRYQQRLFRFCIGRLHHERDAVEVVDRAFAQAERRLDELGKERPFYGWLSVIASNLCTEVLRQRQRAQAKRHAEGNPVIVTAGRRVRHALRQGLSWRPGHDERLAVGGALSMPALYHLLESARFRTPGFFGHLARAVTAFTSAAALTAGVTLAGAGVATTVPGPAALGPARVGGSSTSPSSPGALGDAATDGARPPTTMASTLAPATAVAFAPSLVRQNGASQLVLASSSPLEAGFGASSPTGGITLMDRQTPLDAGVGSRSPGPGSRDGAAGAVTRVIHRWGAHPGGAPTMDGPIEPGVDGGTTAGTMQGVDPPTTAVNAPATGVSPPAAGDPPPGGTSPPDTGTNPPGGTSPPDTGTNPPATDLPVTGADPSAAGEQPVALTDAQ